MLVQSQKPCTKSVEVADKLLRRRRVFPPNEIEIRFARAKKNTGEIGREHAGGFALRVLKSGFEREGHAKAEFPDVREILRFATVQRRRDLVCKNVFGAVDTSEHGDRANLARTCANIVQEINLQLDTLRGEDSTTNESLVALENLDCSARSALKSVDQAACSNLKSVVVVNKKSRGHPRNDGGGARGRPLYLPRGRTRCRLKQPQPKLDLGVGREPPNRNGRPFLVFHQAIRTMARHPLG